MILCRVTLNLIEIAHVGTAASFLFIHALSKPTCNPANSPHHPSIFLPDISNNHAEVYSLVLQISIRQPLHSQRYILPTMFIHHESNQRLLNTKKPHKSIGMHYSDTIQPKKVRKGSSKSSRTTTASLNEPVPCVMESVPGAPGNPKIEKILSDILVKLERIEEKINEAVYPPESAIRPAYVKKIKEAETGLSKGKEKTYSSMDDFIRNIKQ
jgi:hypothetical protein